MEDANTARVWSRVRPVKLRRVRLLVTIVLVATVVAIVWHYVLGFYLGLGYPHLMFLFTPGDRFHDWIYEIEYAREYPAGNPWGFGYFPFAVLTEVAASVVPSPHPASC